jgi:outer membrane protein assembly factor BamA
MGSVEGRVPIPFMIKGLYGAVFVDGGQVSNSTTLNLSGFRITPGVGLRMASILGPIRFDIGFNPYAVAASQRYQELGDNLVLKDQVYRPKPRWYDHIRLNFSIGQAF